MNKKLFFSLFVLLTLGSELNAQPSACNKCQNGSTSLGNVVYQGNTYYCCHENDTTGGICDGQGDLLVTYECTADGAVTIYQQTCSQNGINFQSCIVPPDDNAKKAKPKA